MPLKPPARGLEDSHSSSLVPMEKLTDAKKTVVKFTPKKAGTIDFACGMGMYKGSVVAK